MATARNAVLVLLCVALPAAAAAQVSRTIDFSEEPGSVSLAHAGTEVRLQPTQTGDGMIEVSAVIRIPGYQTIVVSEGESSSPVFRRWVGIGKLSKADPAASVLLAGYTGGAHCCATLKAIVPDAGRLKLLELEAIDGEPDGRFPTDVNQDGIVDFVRQDDSFRYKFASGAGSFSPPKIYNIHNGRLIDVSARPSYRPLWERYAREARARCADQADDDRNGACAAYVAAGARLGRFEQALKEAEQLANSNPLIELPGDCAVSPVDGSCPAGKEIRFKTFSAALRWFLKLRGYVE